MKKFKYFIVVIILMSVLYWWFIYREMSILEHHDSVYYYSLKKEKYSSKEEVGIVREFFIASYVGNKQEFLDTMQNIICDDIAFFDLKKYYVNVYGLPFFIGRISDGPISKLWLKVLVCISWNKRQPNKLKLEWKDDTVEIIELRCV